MKNILLIVGNALFWILWPVWWVYLKINKRTRVLLICGDEFLVLRGWLGSGKWGLPGGGLHMHEDAISGLLREVREETGIHIQKDAVTYGYEATQRDHGLRFVYICFTVVLPKKPTVKRQWTEIAEYAWQPITNPTLPLAPDAATALAWWLNKG